MATVLASAADPAAGQLCGEDSDDFLRQSAARIEALVSQHPGTVGLVVVEPESGACLRINADMRFPAGSLISIPIMIEALSRVEEDQFSLGTEFEVLPLDRVEGSGVLAEMTLPRSVSVWDAVYLMVTADDHTALNVLLAKLPPDWVNDRMREAGLTETRVLMPVGGDPTESPDSAAARRYGVGVTTPREMATLLTLIARGEVVGGADPETVKGILLLHMPAVDGIRRLLPAGVDVAHVVATSPRARHDCGIVDGPNRSFVLCAMTQSNEDDRESAENEAMIMIGSLAALVHEELNRLETPGEGPRALPGPLLWGSLLAAAATGAVVLWRRRQR